MDGPPIHRSASRRPVNKWPVFGSMRFHSRTSRWKGVVELPMATSIFAQCSRYLEWNKSTVILSVGLDISWARRNRLTTFVVMGQGRQIAVVRRHTEWMVCCAEKMAISHGKLCLRELTIETKHKIGVRRPSTWTALQFTVVVLRWPTTWRWQRRRLSSIDLLLSFITCDIYANSHRRSSMCRWIALQLNDKRVQYISTTADHFCSLANKADRYRSSHFLFVRITIQINGN